MYVEIPRSEEFYSELFSLPNPPLMFKFFTVIADLILKVERYFYRTFSTDDNDYSVDNLEYFYTTIFACVMWVALINSKSFKNSRYPTSLDGLAVICGDLDRDVVDMRKT